jgi:glycosyltransferase involved in cell wall biosynthesis
MQAGLSLNDHLAEARSRTRRLRRFQDLRGIERLLHGLNRARTSRREFDIIHHTFYSRDRLGELDPSRSVSTVHDMTPEDLPEYFPRGSPHDAKMQFLRASAAIVCDSQAALARLRAHVDLSNKLTAVVYFGVRTDIGPAVSPQRGLPAQFILHVGGREGYKNGKVVFHAFSQLATRFPQLCLVLVGGGPLSEPERRLVVQPDRVLCLNPSDAQMPGIYAGAAAYVSASISEGFGLPLLEAMASGCPAVVAANDAYLEVGADAAAFFEPSNAGACGAALEEAVSRSDRTSARVRIGLSRSSERTWLRAASEMREFYAQVVKLRPGAS